MDKDKIFKALADPTRRLMLDELSERKTQSLYELCARLVMKHKVVMSRQAITKHLSILEEAGLVKSERQGRYKLIVFNDEPIKKIVERWIKRNY
jgi:DNA-binding transcriptional ArsR family regulator